MMLCKTPFLNMSLKPRIFLMIRTRRTSLRQKFIDSFNVISGDMSTRYEPTFGLFDIMTLGILGALARFDVYIYRAI